MISIVEDEDEVEVCGCFVGLVIFALVAVLVNVLMHVGWDNCSFAALYKLFLLEMVHPVLRFAFFFISERIWYWCESRLIACCVLGSQECWTRLKERALILLIRCRCAVCVTMQRIWWPPCGVCVREYGFTTLKEHCELSNETPSVLRCGRHRLKSSPAPRIRS